MKKLLTIASITIALASTASAAPTPKYHSEKIVIIDYDTPRQPQYHVRARIFMGWLGRYLSPFQ